MKVLFVSVYRDGTGYAHGACDFIRSLDAAGVDVVCRPVRLNNATPKLPARILELEAKSARGADICIQYLLPHQMDYNGRFQKNVAMYASETSGFPASSWGERLNTMDLALVLNHQMVTAAKDSGVTIPLHVVPHGVDLERYERSYKIPQVIRKLKDEGRFVFYFIGEMVRRKNLQGVLRAFHIEFGPQEPVSLVIKTSRSGMAADEVAKHVRGMCEQIKDGLKLYHSPDDYHQEIILTDRLTDESIMGLHAGCDCFVLPSFGEAWSLPAFDAMAMGKTPIVTISGGFLEYMRANTGWLLSCHDEPVFGVDDTFGDLFTGREYWTVPDLDDLRYAMRRAYEDAELRQEYSAAGRRRAYDFAYELSGQKIKDALEASL